MPSLYDKLGGAAAVHAAVDRFYVKVVADPRIQRFFTAVDMDAQKAKQRSFLAMAFGAPVKYTGRDMTAGHAELVKRGLNDAHVDAVLEHLDQTLADLGVPAALIAEVHAIAEGARNAVLGRA